MMSANIGKAGSHTNASRRSKRCAGLDDESDAFRMSPCTHFQIPFRPASWPGLPNAGPTGRSWRHRRQDARRGHVRKGGRLETCLLNNAKAEQTGFRGLQIRLLAGDDLKRRFAAFHRLNGQSSIECRQPPAMGDRERQQIAVGHLGRRKDLRRIDLVRAH
jgi:hypothetical protein